MKLKENKKILILLVFLIVLFMSLVVYLSYFTIFKASAIVDHSANRRGILQEQSIRRGTIYDRNNEVIAYSEGEKGNYQRHYSYPTIYTHSLGYYSRVHGKSGIESRFDKYLSGREGNKTIKAIKAFFNKDIDPNVGDSVKMTTDTNITQKSRDILDDFGGEGAIVVMNPKTGEVISLVSYPDFNLQNIDADFDALREQNKGSFFNRATQSSFAPGSIFKIITSAAILESGVDQNYHDTGEESFGGGLPIRNAQQKAYGYINLNSAFTYSVNTYFANKAVEMGNEKLGEVSEKFMFNKDISFDLNVKPSKFNYQEAENRSLAEAAIGENQTTTPLHMCMMASAIANGGNMMKPYLVSDVISTDGSSVIKVEPEVLSEAVSPENAEIIKNMMISAVNKGSAKAASVRGTQVAGKTGTSQSSSTMNTTWFVGFAPADNPQVCVAIVVKDVDKLAGEVAAPLGGELIDYSLKQLNK
ncbi:peptidoglycan D,D-transpeptidase FtsI family protein [Anaerosphaera multitolerans]|uniref:Penicillin-binding protein 2 n=1 Tax=Anaerosphaera multitolerans TaxID=2487351 RepID=A0A437S797_9FIRM|nr:penicillin-binding protein 2 [Anaerosphaera multitolerans]RVU54929.1 penicillin-binding protein 2 [Anaerosphaera multitolerans]